MNPERDSEEYGIDPTTLSYIYAFQTINEMHRNSLINEIHTIDRSLKLLGHIIGAGMGLFAGTISVIGENNYSAAEKLVVPIIAATAGYLISEHFTPESFTDNQEDPPEVQ